MFETLKTLLAFHGPEAKAIVWAHNSHIGDAAATEMSARGEYNIGHLCREEFGSRALFHRVRNPFGNGRGGVRLGRADGGQGQCCPRSSEAMNGCATKPVVLNSCCR